MGLFREKLKFLGSFGIEIYFLDLIVFYVGFFLEGVWGVVWGFWGFWVL